LSKIRNTDTTKGKRKKRSQERSMCIVRNAGERVGRLAVWELV
jgi:hypothetical protein